MSNSSAEADILLDSKKTGKGFITGENFAYKPVEYSVVQEKDPDTNEPVDLAVFEGCIVLGTVEEMNALSESVKNEADASVDDGSIAHGVGITGRRYRWPRGIVPYEIHPDLPNQARVTDAINHWQSRTRIRFVRRTTANASQYPDYIRVRPASGCWSYVGRQGGRQDLGLAAGCGTGSTIHEFAHAIGLWHEQSREDRNAHVRINYANIAEGREHNFNQHITDGDDYGPYDYGSIMHYSSHAFSRNGKPTIEPIRSGVTLGQRNGLSPGDRAAVRAMYPNLEPSRSWLGVQFRGHVNPNSTGRWSTHSWPAHWHVDWTAVPIGPENAQIELKIEAKLQTENTRNYGSLITYFITIKNNSNVRANVEARYHVLGWTR